MEHAVQHVAGFAPDAQRPDRRICLALIWVGGEVAGAHLEQVISTLRARPDIESATRGQGKANVVMVRFDRGCTSASEIVQALRRAGLRALLVGC